MPERVDQPRRIRARRDLPRQHKLEPARVAANGPHPQVARIDLGNALADRGAHLFGCIVEARHHEGQGQIGAANGGADAAGFPIGVDHQPRQVRRQERNVVQHSRKLCREGIAALDHALLQHRLLAHRVVGAGAGHHEDVLAMVHRIVGRARLRIAAEAPRRLLARRLPAIGRLNLRERYRILAEAEKVGVLHRQQLPLQVLRHRHAARPVRCAIGQRVLAPFEKRLHVVGDALAVVHRHHDGGAAEGPIAGREHLGIARAHAFPLGPHPVGKHHAPLVEIVAETLLPHRGDHHAAADVVLRARHVHRRAPA